MSKAWLLHDSVRYRRSDAALVRIVVPVADRQGTTEAAEQRALAFARAVLPRLSAPLELTMGARIPLAAVLLVSTLALACSRGGSTAQQFVERGDQYAAEGRYDAAVIEYRNALKKQPAMAAVYTKLGDAYAEEGKPEEAYRAYCNATDLDADDGHARVEAGRLLFSAGRYNEALVRAVQTLERDNQNVDAQILSGRALTKLRRYDDAIAQLDAAVAIDHQPSAYAALGDAKLAAGDADGAEAAFRAAVEQAPQSVEARITLADYLVATKRHAEAEQHLQQAVTANPASELANRAAANFYVSSRSRPGGGTVLQGSRRAAEPEDEIDAGARRLLRRRQAATRKLARCSKR